MHPYPMHQLDYLSFITGFSFLVSAVIFFSLAFDRRGRLAWRWASAFSLLQGGFWLLSLLALNLPDAETFRVIRLAVFSTSYLCLLEFVRLGVHVQSGHRPTPLVHLIFPAAVCGAVFGPRALDVFLRLAVMLPCGLSAAVILLKEDGWPRRDPAGFRLGACGAYLAAYTLLIVAAGPDPGVSPFLPPVRRPPEGLPVFLFYLGIAAASLMLASALNRFTSIAKTIRGNAPSRLSDVQWYTWVLPIVLASGWGLTEWTCVREDASIRSEILTQARIASTAIDASEVRALKGGPPDLCSPEYRKIKDRLMDIRRAEPLYRFVYLMGHSGRTLFFYVDSEEPGSQGYSPPGQVYEQSMPDHFLQTFDPGIEITEGPLTDEWGTWISASIPVRDPAAGSVAAVLGVDIDASDWMKRLYHARMQPILATMITTLLVLSFAIYQRRSSISGLKLKASEQTLRYALDATSEGIWDWNIAAGRIKYGQQWAASMGYSPEDVAGMDDLGERIIHPDDRATFHEHMDACLKGGTPVFECEVRMRTKDGAWRCILDRGKVVERDRLGVPVRMVGTFSDITQRRNMEDDLRKKEEQYRQLVDNASDVIYETDADGVIRYLNPAGTRLTGYSEAELIGKPYLHFVRRDWHSEIATRTGIQFVKRIPSIYIECPIVTKSGKEVWIGQNIRLLLDGGVVAGFHSVARDVTERKKAEDALRQSEERANRMAGEARAANEAKSRFLANMSHEIRTPMNGIIGMCELLRGTELSPAQLQYVEIILKSGEALVTLINDILDLSKIEADRLDLETVDFDLRAMLEDLTDLLAVRASEKGIELACLIEPDVPTLLRGDPGRLRQVIVNLAGNAVKFTARGEVCIGVQKAAESPGNADLLFSVRDTGIGIPPDKLPVLFSPFTQVDSSSTRKFGGTGLGLVISKRLTEMMGGTISVESAEGRGSTFSFTVSMGVQPAGGRPAAEPIEGGDSLRVLVADGSAPGGRSLSLMLQSLGVRHEQASGFDDAIRTLREAVRRGDPFTVALLDPALGETDGGAPGKAFRAYPGLRSLPLVALSSIAYRGEVSRFRDDGFSACLTKPVRQAHLLECLVAVLGRQGCGPVEESRETLETGHDLNGVEAGRRRILLVEDNPTNEMAAEGMLRNLGYRTTSVGGGAAAVSALQESWFDLVLMDCQMPGMDGFETTARIRNPESGVLDHDVVIIAMTACAMKGDRERCTAAGMNDYLAKPVRQADLAAMLGKWLPRTGRAAQGPASSRGQVRSAGVQPGASEARQDGPLLVFDHEGLMDRLGGDGDLACAVIESFFESVPGTLSRLDACMKNGDPAGIGLHAHSLKGAAFNAGAAAIGGIARSMEAAGKAGDVNAAASSMPELLGAIDLFRNAAEQAGWLRAEGLNNEDARHRG